MPTLIDLRRRIRSVKNTQQITKAMKTVSTAKFKKAQRFVIEGRPSWHGSPDFLARISRWAGSRSHPLFAVRTEKKVRVIVFTSDKGLCGAFNSNLLSRASEFIWTKAKRTEVRLTLVGKKAVGFFRKTRYPVDAVYAEKVERLSAEELRNIAREQIRAFTLQETDAVYIAYNEFKSVLAPRIAITRLLPVAAEEGPPGTEAPLPEWEPAEAALLEALVPRYVEDQVLHAYYEAQAAEQAARMMAMDNASKNAEELVAALLLVLNKIRQAGITKELLEIMTAVEALKSERE
jgi:F-type H+-transporting ATPase subunit gamma